MIKRAEDRDEITAPRLERALAIVAEIVTRPGGDVYLPIFERLEKELAALTKTTSALEGARAIAANVSPKPSPAIRPAAEDWSQNHT